MTKEGFVREEARFIIRGIIDSMIVLLAASASMGSLYFFYHL